MVLLVISLAGSGDAMMNNLTKQIIDLAKDGRTIPEIAQTLMYPEAAVKQILESPLARRVLGDRYAT